MREDLLISALIPEADFLAHVILELIIAPVDAPKFDADVRNNSNDEQTDEASEGRGPTPLSHQLL